MIPSFFTDIISSPLSGSEFALQMTPAVLHDHSRLAVVWADYPAVVSLNETTASSTSDVTGMKSVTHLDDGHGGHGSKQKPLPLQQTPSASSSVAGFLVFGLTDDDRLNIEEYESKLYNLTPVDVEIEVVDDEDSEDADTASDITAVTPGTSATSAITIAESTQNTTTSFKREENAEKPNRKNATSIIVVEAECHIWAGSRDDLVEIAEREWTMNGFLQSHMGNGYDE